MPISPGCKETKGVLSIALPTNCFPNITNRNKTKIAPRVITTTTIGFLEPPELRLFLLSPLFFVEVKLTGFILTPLF